MSQDNKLSTIIRDLRGLETTPNKHSEEEWSNMHRRIVQLPRTDRRQLYTDNECALLEKVLDWQQTCPHYKRITDAGTNSEEDIRIAFEINKRVALGRGQADTIECDALLAPYYKLSNTRISATTSGRFTIYRDCRSPVNYIYEIGKRFTNNDDIIEFLNITTQSGCRSLVIDLNTLLHQGEEVARTFMSAVKTWLEQNYNLVDKIILCGNYLQPMMLKYFPVYEPSMTDISEGKLPAEIRSKGKRAIQIYKEALSDGKHAVQSIRVMLVGHSGVGKTTLLKRLLGQDVDIKKIESTEGIEAHVHCCKIDVETGQWHCQDKAPPHPDAALLSAILPKFESPVISIQCIRDTSQEFDTSPITEDEDEDEQNVTGVDVTIASEPESDKSENTSEADFLAIIVRPQSSSSDDSDDTKVEQQFEELMETYENNERLSVSKFAKVSFWDFAGQYIFYNTHQVFLSHRTIYLLVTKLKHIVDEASSDTKPDGTIEFWVDCIHFFCGKENHDPRVPPVILVATHCDKIDQAQKEILVHSHFQKVRDIFENKITAGHIVDDLEFAVDNNVEDPELEKLKEAILDVTKSQYYWQEEHPVRWLTLEKELFVKGNSGEKVLQLEAVKDMNRKLLFPLEETELDLFLQFQSDLGNILYISEGELKDYVLLNLQWVADAFKCIITAEHFLNRKMMLRKHWKQATKTGKINTEIIEAVWSDKRSEGFFEEREFLLLLMQQLNLIARPIGSEQPPSHYFVPCLISERPSCLPIPFKGEATSSVLTLSAASRFFPMILFHKLIASCIQGYPIHKDHIYDGAALFQHELHVFTVLYVENTVKVWVKSLDEDNPDSMVCQRVLKFLIECMNKLQLSCIKTPSVAVFACCPDVDMNSVQGMHQLPDDIDQWQALSKEKVVCSNEKCASHTVSMRDALKYWIPVSKNAAGQTYKKALTRAWESLVKDMHSIELLDKIIEKELFTETTIQDLRDERKESDRNRAILKQISTSGPEIYELFKECLTLIKQDHLVKLLQKYETGTYSNSEAMARRPTQQEPDEIPSKKLN